MRVRFDAFEVDLLSGEIRKQGSRVRLQEQPFRVLAALVQRRGQVVTKEELRKAVWTEDTFVDFEHSLATAVAKIREMLGDAVGEPRFIQTLRGRGYRFIAPVEEVDETAPRSTGKIRVAVLPFENLSADAQHEAFCDGLTEELISQAGRLNPQRLGVIARTSAMQYKRSQKTVEQIGRELDVAFVVEGSVRRENGHVRVTAQLIQVQDQTHLWAETYDRDAANVFEVQHDVASRVTGSLALELLPDCSWKV